ncbi:MAG TPA: DUF362 domain-containing protein [Bacteroidales bacterium]|nr:DUF362 domain-containing protein [Bacteroidales bacterium]
MKRRDFLKRGLSVGFVAGTAFTINPYKNLIASPLASDYDMVAIRGGEADSMFDRAIEEMGGMRKFVTKGQTVVVKPNIGWDASPERAANTNPALIKRIIQHCFNAGAKDVYVFDHTCNEWSKCYTNSQIEAAAKDAGAKVVMGNSEKYYQNVTFQGGKVMKDAKIHELILSSDVFINVPVLKNHGGANMTITMKNLMGIVWDRKFWHANDLNQCIADFPLYRKPDLNIVDAYRVMKRNGPRGVSNDDVITMKAQLITTDMVAADTAACKLFGKDPDEVKYIAMAEQLGVGTSDLSKLNISRIKV